MDYHIGIDEVGRGPIAGPLVICACALLTTYDVLPLFPKGILQDSKKLSEKSRNLIRERLGSLLENKTVIYGIGEVSSARIDELGLSVAIREALHSALENVYLQGISLDSKVYLDGGLKVENEMVDQETIIKGDEKIPCIALASIIAKVHRDAFMKEVAKELPLYDFENHVGYGTKAHYEAITKYGVTNYHRKSFLKNIIN